MATRRAGVREVATHGRQHPDARDAVRRPSRTPRRPSPMYDVPLRKDWAILDGLNYIKDHVDGSLSYRWSCRMGICGSCGMNVEGEPKLTCATFLTDYAPGPIRVEPLTNFPVVRDLVVDIEDFMEKLPRVKPWIIRDDDVIRDRWRVRADPGGAGGVQAVQQLHQLHALLRRMSDLRHRPGPSSAQPPSPSLSGTTWTLATGDSENASTCSSSAKAYGAAPLSVSAPGYAPSTSTRQVPSSDTSSRPPRRT